MSYIKHWTTSSAWLTSSIGLSRVDQNSTQVVNSNIYCIMFATTLESFTLKYLSSNHVTVFLSPISTLVIWYFCCLPFQSLLVLLTLRTSALNNPTMLFFATAPLSSVENGTVSAMDLYFYIHIGSIFHGANGPSIFPTKQQNHRKGSIPASTDYTYLTATRSTCSQLDLVICQRRMVVLIR